jgi:hypothetical protein
MGWLDAHEYFIMERVARDRVDDIRVTVGLALASADGAAEMPRRIPEPGTPSSAGWSACSSIAPSAPASPIPKPVSPQCAPGTVAQFLVTALEGAILMTTITKEIGGMAKRASALKRYLSLDGQSELIEQRERVTSRWRR